MKLAASNIAWEPGEDEEVASRLRAFGFSGVELAPAKAFSNRTPNDAAVMPPRKLRRCIASSPSML